MIHKGGFKSKIKKAQKLFLEYRPESTPVVIARNLGRTDETVRITTLAELDTKSVDMLTLVIVGNSETRIFNHTDGVRTYTPRGYRMAIC